MYDFIEDPLFENPIPKGTADADRAKLQAVIDRMEIERKKCDAILRKEG